MHKGVIPKVLKLAKNIKRVSSKHFAVWSQKLLPMKEKWTKPPQDWSKVSFHDVLRDTFSTQAAVCRNHKGKITQILTQVRPPCNQVNGEAQPTKLAGMVVSSMQLNKFILEGESSTVILALYNSAFSLDFPFDHVFSEVD
jgi:hypothetical protein